jgi:hypothetical protein
MDSEPVHSDSFKLSHWNSHPVKEMLDEFVPKSGPHTINAKKKVHGSRNVWNKMSLAIDLILID